MKIALIGRYGEGDIIPGPERVARELYRQLKKQNFDVTFLEYFFSDYSDYSFTKKIFGKKRKGNNILRLGAVPIIMRLLKEQYDIIHFINIQRFQIIVFIFKPFFKSKLVSSLHGPFKDEVKLANVKRSFMDLWVEKLSVSKSDVLIFPSKLLLNRFEKEYNISQKHFIIPNGVDEEFIEKQMVPDFSEEYKFVYYNSFNIGLEELLNNLLNDPDFKLFVIGKEKEVKNKNINVTFVNPMNKGALLNFLSDKHFVIKSSAFDSFSIFVVECMCLGIVPIVSENTGVKDFIENGINGFVYENSASNNLKDVLNDIQRGKYELNMISTNAKKICNELNWGKISEQYISLYRSII
jgi:glycosyltransferase involved in cell wall biosynthesis